MQMKPLARSFSVIVAALLMGSAPYLRADDAKPADKPTAEVKPPPPKKWDSTATAGVSLSRGNSKSFLASGAFTSKRSWTSDEVILGANGGYGKSTVRTGTTETDNITDSYLRGAVQWNHLFSPKLYSGLKVAGEHDDVAALAYRITVSPMVGYYFIKQTNAIFSVEAGPSYVHEKFFDTDIFDDTGTNVIGQQSHVNDYLALRIGQHGEYIFKTKAKVWETLEYLPAVTGDDIGSRFLFNAEVGASAPISKSFSVSLVMQDNYASKPANDRLKNDFRLIAGLTFNF